MHNLSFHTASEALPVLMGLVLNDGDEVGSRNGRTMELSPVHIELTQPWRREILVPGRKALLPAQIAETMWVLSGRDDIEWLGHYLPRAGDFSDDGKVWRGAYGPRLRRWKTDDATAGARSLVGETDDIDQLAHVVNLLKNDPLSRRAVISLYDPVTDTQPGKDIPCNNWLHFMSRLGKLDLHVTIRSNDLMWGWSGINAFEWSVVQEIVASLLGVQVGSLHFNISSLHLYENHWKRAEEISRAIPLTIRRQPTRFAPRVKDMGHLDHLVAEWFNYENEIRNGRWMKEIEQFPEPMMQEWLWVLAAHWTDDAGYLQHVGEPLMQAAMMSPKRKIEEPITITREELTQDVDFVKYVSDLHEEKHAAYGDSWKKRGEMLGIMANIARKVDRLGVSDDHETAADTAIDLLVYLAKYRWWLSDEADAPLPQLLVHGEETYRVEKLLSTTAGRKQGHIPAVTMEDAIRQQFDQLEHLVTEKRDKRYALVDSMIDNAYVLASHLWWKQNNATRPFTGYADPEELPHSRACGITKHEHGFDCHSNCPTCGGQPL